MTESTSLRPLPETVAGGKPVKLVVWDLDHTLWDGVLLEDGEPNLAVGVQEVIAGLDQLGILQSIASRNDFDAAVAHLKRLGVLEYFLIPQIAWCPKSQSIAAIAAQLNIGLDSVLLVDDQDFELEEVRFAHPQMRTLHAVHARHLLDDTSVRPAVITDDASRRRLRYLEDQARTQSERIFAGTPEQFLMSLNLELTLARASAADLDRAEELVIRTNQLNSTGIIHSRSELHSFIDSATHCLVVASLKDRFGDYGTIGVALLETAADLWTLKLILVSCRVLSRGIGPILLDYFVQRAHQAGVVLRVDFRDTGTNRPMKVALMMTGFSRSSAHDSGAYLYRDDKTTPTLPAHLRMSSSW